MSFVERALSSLVMELVRTFLESSSIHGLSYIASTRKVARIGWFLIIFVSFSCAENFIFASFQSWSKNPVTTTIETLPLSDIRLPKITICPPRNTFTDLNYDMKQNENITFSKETREEMIKTADDIISNHVFLDIFNKLNEENRFFNWYHGFSQLTFPRMNYQVNDGGSLKWTAQTSALSGLVYTNNFGEEFNLKKVQRTVTFLFKVFPPKTVGIDQNATLHFEIEKLQVPLDSIGTQDMYESSDGNLDLYESKFHLNFTPPFSQYKFIKLSRKFFESDILSGKINIMPGFKFKWYYTGNVQPQAKFQNDEKTVQFIR